MKLRRAFCVAMACALLCSFHATSAGTASRASGKFSTDVPANNIQQADMPANNIQQTNVPANNILQADKSFPLAAGETVRINASYTPDASVDFGLIDEDGIFHFLTVTNGSIDITIRISRRGHYTLAIRNNASVDISVSGYVTY